MNKKILSTLISVMLIISMFASVIAIDDLDPTSPQGNEMSGAVSKILGYVQWFGYAIAVGMLIYIGVKYVMASAAEKGDLKKGLINYVIGAVLIAAASTIAGWIVNIGTGLSGGGTDNG